MKSYSLIDKETGVWLAISEGSGTTVICLLDGYQIFLGHEFGNQLQTEGDAADGCCQNDGEDNPPVESHAVQVFPGCYGYGVVDKIVCSAFIIRNRLSLITSLLWNYFYIFLLNLDKYLSKYLIY